MVSRLWIYGSDDLSSWIFVSRKNQGYVAWKLATFLGILADKNYSQESEYCNGCEYTASDKLNWTASSPSRGQFFSSFILNAVWFLVTNVKKPSPIYYQQLLIRDKAKEDFDKIKDYFMLT